MVISFWQYSPSRRQVFFKSFFVFIVSCSSSFYCARKFYSHVDVVVYTLCGVFFLYVYCTLYYPVFNHQDICKSGVSSWQFLSSSFDWNFCKCLVRTHLKNVWLKPILQFNIWFGFIVQFMFPKWSFKNDN